MKIKTVTTNRYPASRKHFILNLVVSLWFTGEKARILKLGNPKRTALWNKMDPFNMVVEPPVLFQNEKFIACLIDRPAGVLLPDRKVPLIDFDKFLEESLPSDNINTDGDYNKDLAAKIESGLTVKDMYAAIHDQANLSTDPIFYLTKIDGSDEYVILYDNKSQEADFSTMVSWIFRDYDFEEIKMNAYDKDDEEVKSLSPSIADVSTFYTGTVSVSDKVLKEKSLTFNFIDMQLLAEVVANIDDVVIVKVDDGEPTEVEDLTSTELTVGDGTTITTSAETEKDAIVLETVKDDQGNDITTTSTLVLTESGENKTQFAASLKLEDYPYAFCFLNAKGYRRSVTAEIKMKDGTKPAFEVEFPINYALKESTYSPVLSDVTPTDATSDDKPVYTIAFELKETGSEEGAILESVVPHTLGEGFALFESGNGISFVGPDVKTDGTKLLIDVVFDKYGTNTTPFSDKAVSALTYDTIYDPKAQYAFAKQTVDYDNGNLTVMYYVYGPEGVPIDLSNSKFDDDNYPLINGVKPTVDIDEAAKTCTLTWMVGETEATSSAVEGIFLLGLNKVKIHYNDNLEYGGVKKQVGIDRVTLTNPSTISDLEGTKHTVASDLAITTTDLVNSSKLIISDVVDRAGASVSDVKLVVPAGENFEFTGNVELGNYPFAFAFKHSDGGRRKLSGNIAVDGSTAATKPVDILIDYKYADKSITPAIASAVYDETAQDKSAITLQVTLTDANSKAITSLLKDTFEDGYSIFATDSNNQLTLNKPTVGVVTTEDSQQAIELNISAAKYGNFDAAFKDTALANLVGSFADPSLTYILKRTDLAFSDQTLTLTYQLTDSDSNNIELYNGTFGESVPNLDLDGGAIEAKYTWDNGKLTVIFEGVTTSDVPAIEIESEFFIGSNKMAISYVESYTPEQNGDVNISDVMLQGGSITGQNGKATYTFGQGTLIILDKENAATVDDLKLVKLVDAIGEDITDKTTATFTKLDDAATQFMVELSVADYALPLAFDNQGSSGSITATFSCQGNKKEATANYNATWGYETIIPKVESVVKSDKGWDINLSFKDSDGNVFATAVQQTLDDSYPLLDETGDNAAKYAGGGVTFSNNTNANTDAAIATVSVTIAAYGAFTIKFANAAFKEATGSLADPAGDYKLNFLDTKVVSSTNSKAIRFELYNGSDKATIQNGYIIDNSLKVTKGGEDTTFATYWTDSSILNLGIADDKPEEAVAYTVSGKFYIGSNQLPVDVSWSGNIPDSSVVKAKTATKNKMLS